MARDIPAWMPTSIAIRMRAQNIKSVRELERRAGVSNQHMEKILKRNRNESIIQMVNILRALGYQCNAPEFDVIRELISEKPLSQSVHMSTISQVNKTQNS